jgi:hypothetical protein
VVKPQNLQQSCAIKKAEQKQQKPQERAKRAVAMLTEALMNRHGIIGVGTDADNTTPRIPKVTVFVTKEVVNGSAVAGIPHSCLGVPVVIKVSEPFKAQ